MTTTAPAIKEFKLPDPKFPVVNRVQTDPVFPTDGDPRALRDQEPMTWKVGEAHPIIGPTSKIARMFVNPGQGVDVYCLAETKTPDGRDANIASRHTIPWDRIRDVEELMDPETFLDEIARAEDDDGDDPAHGKTNGAAAS